MAKIIDKLRRKKRPFLEIRKNKDGTYKVKYSGSIDEVSNAVLSAMEGDATVYLAIRGAVVNLQVRELAKVANELSNVEG